MGGKIENPVVLATFSSLADALVLRSRLEYEGITCLIPDEHTASITPYLMNFAVRIIVDEKDYLAAKAVMDDIVDP